MLEKSFKNLNVIKANKIRALRAVLHKTNHSGLLWGPAGRVARQSHEKLHDSWRQRLGTKPKIMMMSGNVYGSNFNLKNALRGLKVRWGKASRFKLFVMSISLWQEMPLSNFPCHTPLWSQLKLHMTANFTPFFSSFNHKAFTVQPLEQTQNGCCFTVQCSAQDLFLLHAQSDCVISGLHTVCVVKKQLLWI